MSRPTLQLAALKRVYIKSMMKVMGAKTPRQLIDIIVETTGAKRRVEVSDAMRERIRDLTVGKATAAYIARELGLSEPTIVAQRRKLGLVRHRASTGSCEGTPAEIDGVYQGPPHYGKQAAAAPADSREKPLTTAPSPA